MKLLVLRSRRRRRTSASPAGTGRDDRKGQYTLRFTSAYAERVIGNLEGRDDFCTACGPDCIACRKAYGRRFGGRITAIIDLPAVLPYLLESPARYVPADVPPHDVLLAIHVHEQILIEFVRAARRWGTRGVVVPVEDPEWISPAGRADAEAAAAEVGVEIAFPRPFCSFDPPAGGVLAEFRRTFCIGKPQVELTVKEGVIQRAFVHVSAACGATYYVARWLVGRGVDDDLKFEVIARRMHSYPCTASMAWDDEVGDTLLHVANQAHYEILRPLGGVVEDAGGMVMSPLGRMLPKPVPARENVQNIDRAKQAILEALAGGALSLADLRGKPGISPAAMYSALVLLEQEGKVHRAGDRIVRTAG